MNSLDCAICGKKRLDKSQGTYHCLNCDYYYPIFSEDKMKKLSDYSSRVLKGGLSRKDSCALAEEMIKIDESNPYALLIKGNDSLKRGFTTAAMRTWKRAINRLARDLDMEKASHIYHHLIMLIISDVRSYCLEKFVVSSKRFSRNPTISNRELIMDSMDEVYRLLSLLKEFVEIPVSDITILKLCDDLVISTSPYIKKSIDNIFDQIKRLASNKTPTCLSPILNSLNNILFTVSELYRFSHLSGSIEEMNKLDDAILACYIFLESSTSSVDKDILALLMVGSFSELRLYLINRRKETKDKQTLDSLSKEIIGNWMEAYYRICNSLYKEDKKTISYELQCFGISKREIDKLDSLHLSFENPIDKIDCLINLANRKVGDITLDFMEPLM